MINQVIQFEAELIYSDRFNSKEDIEEFKKIFSSNFQVNREEPKKYFFSEDDKLKVFGDIKEVYERIEQARRD